LENSENAELQKAVIQTLAVQQQSGKAIE